MLIRVSLVPSRRIRVPGRERCLRAVAAEVAAIRKLKQKAFAPLNNGDDPGPDLLSVTRRLSTRSTSIVKILRSISQQSASSGETGCATQADCPSDIYFS